MISTRRNSRAFTIIELLLVMFVIGLLTVMVVPSLSRFAHSSKIDQAVRIVISSVRQARYTAMNMRRMTAVMYGDDLGGIEPKPIPGVLPRTGDIEIWTVLEGIANGTPYQPDVTWPQDWYPFRFPDVPITPKPIKIPEGVRIVTGFWDDAVGKKNFTFNYRKTAQGELARHMTVFNSDGSLPAWHCNAGSHVLVFDPATGEHAIILTGAAWSGYQSPRVISRKIEKVGGTPLTDPRDLSKRINEYPGNM